MIMQPVFVEVVHKMLLVCFIQLSGKQFHNLALMYFGFYAVSGQEGSSQ